MRETGLWVIYTISCCVDSNFLLSLSELFSLWYSNISQAVGAERPVCSSGVCVGVPSRCGPPHSLTVSIKVQQPIDRLALPRQEHWGGGENRPPGAVALLRLWSLEREQVLGEVVLPRSQH